MTNTYGVRRPHDVYRRGGGSAEPPCRVKVVRWYDLDRKVPIVLRTFLC